jgi:hypothetical protein
VTVKSQASGARIERHGWRNNRENKDLFDRQCPQRGLSSGFDDGLSLCVNSDLYLVGYPPYLTDVPENSANWKFTIVCLIYCVNFTDENWCGSEIETQSAVGICQNNGS